MAVAVLAGLAVSLAVPAAHAQLIGDDGLIDVEVTPGDDPLIDLDVRIGNGAGCDTVGCFALETEFLGPDGPEVRLHRNLTPSLDGLTQWAIDVDKAGGYQQPIPMLLVPVGLDYDLAVSISRNSKSLPSADDFTLSIGKLLFASPTLPLRAEIVNGDVDDPEAENKTLGYDALDSTAPLSFELGVVTTGNTVEAAGWRQDESATTADVRVTGPGSTLAVLTETFNGEFIEGSGGSGFVRPDDRSRSRLHFSGTGADGTRVPGSIGLRLFERSTPVPPPDAPDDAQPPSQLESALTELALTHDARTTLGLELGDPDGATTTGTVDELPAALELTVADEDVNDDGQLDDKIDYRGSSLVERAELANDDGENKVASAVIERIPVGETDLTYATSETPDVETTEITYHSAGRAGSAKVGLDEPGRQMSATVVNVPANIDKLRFEDTGVGEDDVDSGEFVYDADASADSVVLAARDGQKVIDATVERVPSDIESLRYEVTEETSEESSEFVCKGTTSTPCRRTVESTDKTVEVIYDANAETTGLTVDATGLDDLPGAASEAHLRVRGIPSFVKLGAVKGSVLQETLIPKDPPPLKQCTDDQGNPIPCPPPEECLVPEPPLDCDYSENELEITAHSEIKIEPGPGERVGLAELQLTSGPDDRLPDEADSGRPQDGLLIRDLADRDVTFARIRELDRLSFATDSFKKEIERLPLSSGIVEFQRKEEEMRVELDTREAEPGAGKNAFALDLREDDGSLVETTTALLDELPDEATLEIGDSDDRLGISGKSVIEYHADTAVGGLELLGTRAPSGGGDPETIQEATLTPMPADLVICESDRGQCVQGVFDPGIQKLAEGDPDIGACIDCADLELEKLPILNDGSFLITATPATHLVFEKPEGESGERKSIDLRSLRRFGLMAGKLEGFDCFGDISACDEGYVAIDTGGDTLGGEIKVEPDDPSEDAQQLVFPDGWSAHRRVLGFFKRGFPAKGGKVGLVGQVTCPSGTRLQSGDNDFRDFFCAEGGFDAWEDLIDEAVAGALGFIGDGLSAIKDLVDG